VAGGADAIGMAGGDGSQATVADVAAAHDLPYVCVPAGTRNHFALDIGVDRNDLVGAVDAFPAGTERRVDLADVNGRVFVNNVSMGMYGRIVQSPAYRDAKFRTVIEMLPQLLGPGREPFDLQLTGPDGVGYEGADLVLVSNNPYVLDRLEPQGTRGAMDRGTLGVVMVPSGPRFHRVLDWAVPALRVDSNEPVSVGLDGEALILEPPLLFRSRASALRIRVPTRRHHRPPTLPRRRPPPDSTNHEP
jgi:diacylglycerol kinase family enzyme